MYLIETTVRSLLILTFIVVAILAVPFVLIWFGSLLAVRYFLAVQLLEADKHRKNKLKVKE